MGGLVVLVTGVTRFLGSRLAGRLAEHPAVERVIGVDAALPEPAARARMGAADFARVDIRNPLVARVIEAAGVDTVVHASASATPASSAARTHGQGDERPRHHAVAGRLPARRERPAPHRPVDRRGLRRLLPRPGDLHRGHLGAVRAVRRARPGTPSTSRPTSAVSAAAGPTCGSPCRGSPTSSGRPCVTPLTRYFSLSPVVPTVLGRNARLQLVHEQDAVAVLEHLALGEFAGTVNVAGDGAITLGAGDPPGRPGAAAVPRRRPRRLVPDHANAAAGRVLAQSGEAAGVRAGARHHPAAGRAGFVPRFTTIEAFDDFAASLRPVVSAETVRRAEIRVADMLRVTPEPLGAEPVTVGRRAMTAVAEREPDGPAPADPDLSAAEASAARRRTGRRPTADRAVRGWSASPARRPGTPRRRRTR